MPKVSEMVGPGTCVTPKRFLLDSPGQSMSGIQRLFFFPSLWPLCMTFIWAIVDGASLVAQTVKNPPEMQATGIDPWVGKIPWRRTWQPTLVFLPQESHGQGSLVGYSAWSPKEWDTTEQPTLSLWVGMRNKDFFFPLLPFLMQFFLFGVHHVLSPT